MHAAATALAAPAPGDQALLDELVPGGAKAAGAAGACLFVAGCGEDSAVVYGYSPDAKPPVLQARALPMTAGASLPQWCTGDCDFLAPQPWLMRKAQGCI